MIYRIGLKWKDPCFLRKIKCMAAVYQGLAIQYFICRNSWGSMYLTFLLAQFPDYAFLYARLKNYYYAVAMSVRPSVCPSVRLSVRPSVRPRFPDFSSTCFEISIWNLVYTFSRWHDMSSLSCITIGSLWPSLQPKVSQTYFLQSWPHK